MFLAEGPERGEGSYSHFPAQILTKSHCPRAQTPSSQWLSCSNLNPIPIFYCFVADESQSQCMKSHFPPKNKQTPVPILPLQDPLSKCSPKERLSELTFCVSLFCASVLKRGIPPWNFTCQHVFLGDDGPSPPPPK